MTLQKSRVEALHLPTSKPTADHCGAGIRTDTDNNGREPRVQKSTHTSRSTVFFKGNCYYYLSKILK
jgi:hypothetical protein